MIVAREERQKVAVFTDSIVRGGACRMMVNLARGFAERGIPVDLVVGVIGGTYLKEIPPGVRLIHFGDRRIHKLLVGLVRYVARERPVALIATKDRANMTAVLARMLTRSSTRVVVRIASNISQEAKNPNRWRYKYIPTVARHIYRRADHIVAISKGVAADAASVIGMPQDGITVIYNHFMVDDIIRRSAHDPQHPWLQSKEPPVILAVGRLTFQKDFETLIKAFAKVRAVRQARLLIVGEGEDRPRLEELVRSLDLDHDVQLPGFVENPFAYMARSRVVAVSSVYEGFCNVVAEALAVGVNVVSTDCESGPREILRDGEFGRLVPVGDQDRLAEALIEALDSEVDSARLRQRAQAFSFDTAVDKYIDLVFGSPR